MGKSRWNKHNPLGAPSPSPTATSAWVWTMSAPCLAWRSQMPGPWKQGCCFHVAGNCHDFSFFFKHGSFWKVHGTMGRNRDQENMPDFINWGVSLYPLGELENKHHRQFCSCYHGLLNWLETEAAQEICTESRSNSCHSHTAPMPNFGFQDVAWIMAERQNLHKRDAPNILPAELPEFLVNSFSRLSE